MAFHFCSIHHDHLRINSTQQLANSHSIPLHTTSLEVNGKLLERTCATKFLGLNITENLTWNDHIRSLSSACYSTLVILSKIKNFTPFYFRKQLAEQLILSKMDYGSVSQPGVREPLGGAWALGRGCMGFRSGVHGKVTVGMNKNNL